MLHFQYIEYLVALLAIPLIYFLYFLVVKWKKATAKKIGDPFLVKELTKEYSVKKFRIKFILFIVAFALCAFAVAGLVIPDGNQKIQRKGTDIVVALDVSKSMLATDIKPDRLERAKQIISKIIDNSPNDRIGLVIFAGRAYLQMPLTLDHAAARMYLASAKPGDVPTQGTAISDALEMSMDAFNLNEKTFKSVLLISDGEDHEPGAVKMAKDLLKSGIIVNTIGIGSPLGAPILDEETGQYKLNEKGETVITKLNEESLRNIAKAGNGMYQLYSNSDDIAKNLKDKFSTIEEDSIISDASYGSFIQYFQYFLGIAFLLLLIEFFTSEKSKKAMVSGLMICFIIFTPGNSYAQSAKEKIVKGNKAYIENRFDEAENDYRDALKKSENDPTANYNLGNTLYRKDITEEAAKAYDHVIANTENNTLKQKAFYNKGVALQKAKKLPESIIAYKNALILNPEDEDARQNLQRAMQEQKQQEKKNQENKQDNQNKKQDNQDQKKKQDQEKDKDPKPQPSKLTQKQAEEKLKSLFENEKSLQDKLNKIKGAAPQKPEKDW
jgi:Ca-activated chloride channel family protein